MEDIRKGNENQFKDSNCLSYKDYLFMPFGHLGLEPFGSGVWQYGLWSFQTGGTKLESFWPKNQHPQRKLLNFDNWISGGLRSFQKSEF